MVDIVDASVRSRMMSGIRGKNTKPELLIRKALHKRGFRYSLHPKSLLGKPDIVLPKWKVAIFVHGCFWHWHGCALSKLPASNTEFWRHKLLGNQLRDAEVKQRLAASGWRVATIWECATRGASALASLQKTLDQLDFWIRGQAKSAYLELGTPNFPAPSIALQPLENNDIQANRPLRRPGRTG